jgi:thioredoxin 1
MKILWFTAPWCRPCKNMEPVIDELRDEHPNLEVERIDVEARPDRAELHGVRAVPTFIFLADDAETGRIAGAVPKDKLSALITSWVGPHDSVR